MKKEEKQKPQLRQENQPNQQKWQPKTVRPLRDLTVSSGIMTTWVTAEDAKDTDESNAEAVMKNVEYILEKMDLLGPYRNAISAAGGDSCPWSEKLKIAGYVYFGTGRDENGKPFVNKPMSLLKESEKDNRVRNPGLKKWGDIKDHPVRVILESGVIMVDGRPYIPEQTLKTWRDGLYPVPVSTAVPTGSFRDLCLDDRIKWVHSYLSRYHSLLARSEKGDVAVLKAMEQTCRSCGIPVFTNDRRKAEYISFLVEENLGLATTDELDRFQKELESASWNKREIVHDAKTREIGFPEAVRLLVPTMKALKLYDLYREYSSAVKVASVTSELIEGERDLAIAKYLITCRPDKGAINVNLVPEFLLKAIDSRNGREDEFKTATVKASGIRHINLWLRPGGVKVNRSIMYDIALKINGAETETMKIGSASVNDPAHLESMAMKKVKAALPNFEVRKIIVVPGRFVNVVGETKDLDKVVESVRRRMDSVTMKKHSGRKQSKKK